MHYSKLPRVLDLKIDLKIIFFSILTGKQVFNSLFYIYTYTCEYIIYVYTIIYLHIYLEGRMPESDLPQWQGFMPRMRQRVHGKKGGSSLGKQLGMFLFAMTFS